MATGWNRFPTEFIGCYFALESRVQTEIVLLAQPAAMVVLSGEQARERTSPVVWRVRAGSVVERSQSLTSPGLFQSPLPERSARELGEKATVQTSLSWALKLSSAWRAGNVQVLMVP